MKLPPARRIKLFWSPARHILTAFHKTVVGYLKLLEAEQQQAESKADMKRQRR